MVETSVPKKYAPKQLHSLVRWEVRTSCSEAIYLTLIAIVDDHSNKFVAVAHVSALERDALGNVVYESQPAPAPTTVLTIRAKKADVDAFAAGQIDLEQFQQRVNVLTY